MTDHRGVVVQIVLTLTQFTVDVGQSLDTAPLQNGTNALIQGLHDLVADQDGDRRPGGDRDNGENRGKVGPETKTLCHSRYDLHRPAEIPR